MRATWLRIASPALLAIVLAGMLFFHSPTPSLHAAPSTSTTFSTSSLSLYGIDDTGQPCANAPLSWPHSISQWTVPLGCFGHVFSIDPHHYVYRPGFGWCNWWPEVLHPTDPNVLYDTHEVPLPAAGDIVFFDGGVQGAGWDGHWAQAVAVVPGGYWVLITEMNFAWRGAGWQKVDYRFIHVGPGVHFKHW